MVLQPSYDDLRTRNRGTGYGCLHVRLRIASAYCLPITTSSNTSALLQPSVRQSARPLRFHLHTHTQSFSQGICTPIARLRLAGHSRAIPHFRSHGASRTLDILLTHLCIITPPRLRTYSLSAILPECLAYTPLLRLPYTEYFRPSKTAEHYMLHEAVPISADRFPKKLQQLINWPTNISSILDPVVSVLLQ
jgi:hypothetical protein